MATQTTSLIVRKAAEPDIPQLAEFILPFVDDRKLLPRTLTELRDLLDSFFVAEYDGHIVGCAALEIYSWKLAEVRSLAVAPNMQGLGIGQKLVQACIDRARAENILEVMAITSADAFFMNCGFNYTLPGEKRALFIQTREL